MKRRSFMTALFALLLFTFSPEVVWAEPVSQTFMLKPGWNAVFLEVEPDDNDPATDNDSDPAVVFSGISDLISVWWWNPRTSTVEYIQSPDELVAEQPQWMVYFPDPDPNDEFEHHPSTNLFAIHGETAYLIHLGGSADVTWTVTGEPKVPKIEWKSNSFNFVGFHLTEGQEPHFQDFFSASQAHAGQEIYRLDNATGTWERVTDPTIPMIHGEAFWVYCQGHSEFTGPLSVQLEQGGGLDYGTALVEQDLRVLNNSNADKAVTLSAAPSAGYLHYWKFDPQNNVAGWFPFSSTDFTIAIKFGEKQTLRLGVSRAGFTAGDTYATNVEIKDEDGMTILLPVSVEGISFAGLWVGDATITKVSEVRISDTSVPTGSEFSFRLIIHAADTGEVHLLKEVIQMWQEGTWKPDPDDLGKLIVDDPGHFVLLGDDSLIPNYTGAAMRDGRLVGRRISSANFGFTSPVVLNGNWGDETTLSTTLILSEDDPSNPFMHRYHPDHQVLNSSGEIIVGQSYEVTRVITMEFRDRDSQGRPITGIPIISWGSTDTGGIYHETITGLHKDPIYIQGTFRLHKVSDVGTLTMP